MRISRFVFSPALAFCLGTATEFSSPAQAATVNVPEHHNRSTRDGLFVDPAFTTNAVANLTRLAGFSGVVGGSVYAQPLYIEGGTNGRALVIAVTESNNVYALDAGNGTVVWQRNVGTPVPVSALPCGNINPLGITGTPVVDLASRALFFDAMTTPDGGTTKQHKIFSLNVDTGAINTGWPVDVNASAHFGTNNFNSAAQHQRGALAALGGYIYVPYGGHAGDCVNTMPYWGWIVGVQMTNPANVVAWATTARGGAAWASGGVASDDGTNAFIATGNSYGVTNTWGGGEAIVKFSPGPVFSTLAKDYWAPTNWYALDTNDLDLGSSGPLIVDVPGATPPKLLVALGKDGNAYLLNRTNLGGVIQPLSQTRVSSNKVQQAAATFRTALGTGVALTGVTNLITFRISAANPPVATAVWTNNEFGKGSPFVTSTDGSNNVVVWGIGAEGDQRLHGFNADTGAALFGGGGTNELMAGTRRFITGIAARGKIYVAGDNRIYAFTVPVPPIVLNSAKILGDGTFQFSFTNTPGLGFTVYSSTNLQTAFTNWTRLGSASENSAGQFQFTENAPLNGQRFYRVTYP